MRSEEFANRRSSVSDSSTGTTERQPSLPYTPIQTRTNRSGPERLGGSSTSTSRTAHECPSRWAALTSPMWTPGIGCGTGWIAPSSWKMIPTTVSHTSTGSGESVALAIYDGEPVSRIDASPAATDWGATYQYVSTFTDSTFVPTQSSTTAAGRMSRGDVDGAQLSRSTLSARAQCCALCLVIGPRTLRTHVSGTRRPPPPTSPSSRARSRTNRPVALQKADCVDEQCWDRLRAYSCKFVPCARARGVRNCPW
jgi:hypothetical protein